ncbi:MAG: hypothetical protein ACFFHD_03520, partial [Promethearchaeota archaeon]
NTELYKILDFFKERISRREHNPRSEMGIFSEILNKKREQYEEFTKEIKLKWDDFNHKNEERIIKKTFTSFFYNNFHEIFKDFIYKFFGFDKNSLEIIIKEKISDKILFLEYNYYLTREEKNYFDKTSKDFKVGIFYSFSFTTGYLYFLIRLLGITIRKTIQEKLFISLDGATVREEGSNNTLKFMIIIKDSKDEIFNSYYNMALYYFLRHFKGIPEKFHNKLLEGREKLYQTATEEYSLAKEKLVDLLYYFYKKCNLLQSFSPLLDFFNFVGSRVEDSVFSKLEIIRKDFLSNLDYSIEKKNSLIKFFNFLDRNSTLYSTFQANNLPSPKSQLNLFLLYMKYYFGSGLEALEVGDLLFLPKIFKTTLDHHNKNADDLIGANFINQINIFLNFVSALSNIENINIFFQKVFKKKISQLNYDFFKTFLKSFNSNLANKIEQENLLISKNSDNTAFSFNIIVDHICRMLYVLIDNIFLKSTPEEASVNFIDPRSRYIGKNIALRVLELFFFQDINYSDDVWPDYLISLNKENIKQELQDFDITIPDTYFYTREELIQIMLIYNIHAFSDQPFFEDWIIYEIIIPLYDLISYIYKSVGDPSNEVEVVKKLYEFFLSDIEDKEIINDFKLVCQQLAPFWKQFKF